MIGTILHHTALGHYILRLWDGVKCRLQISIWKKMRKAYASNTIAWDENKLVIIPSSASTIAEARGDEAMLTVAAEYFKNKNPKIEIYIVTDHTRGPEIARSLGYQPIPAWNGYTPLKKIFDGILKVAPKNVVIIGADCMDGYYSQLLSMILLGSYDLASTLGMNTALLGFSFNAQPSKRLRSPYQIACQELTFNLRDHISLTRFNAFTGCKKGRLTADVAFLLQPSSDFPEYTLYEYWIQEKQSHGKTVIGFNAHPMLEKGASEESLKQQYAQIAENLSSILQQHESIYFVFMPHDKRANISDTISLDALAALLKERNLSDRFLYDSKVFHAAEIKALCGLFDGVIASRMHLSIAALGCLKPVLGITYQGKFEGLFAHYQLDQKFLMDAKVFASKDFIAIFNEFIASLPALKAQIQKEDPKIKELAKKNFLNGVE